MSRTRARGHRCASRSPTPASGIDAEQTERLFEAFTQADGSTTRQYGGTGLGLTISRELVELMGGQIGARPQAPRGSVFWFTAPLPFASVPSAEMPESPDLQGVRALIVDENATNRAISRHYLRIWGLETDSAATASAALQTLERAAEEGRAFGLALLDFDMPHMDGMELAERDPPQARTARPQGGAPQLRPVASGKLRRSPLRAGPDQAPSPVRPV